MLLRDATAADDEAVRAVVAEIWGHDKQWGPGRSDEHLAAGDTLVAVVDDEVVGIASFRRGSVPNFGVLVVDVRADHQRRGAGSALLAEIRNRHPGHRMMIRTRPWDEATTGFVTKHGFDVAERVIEGWLEPDEPSLTSWIDEAVATGVAVESMGNAHRDIPEVAAVIDDWMVRHHHWVPMSPRSSEEAFARYIEPALPGTLGVIRDQRRIVAAGLLHPDPFGTQARGAHLVYLGFLPAPNEYELVKTLFAHCLSVARREERPVQIEAPTHHVALSRVLSELPVDTLFEGLVIYTG